MIGLFFLHVDFKLFHAGASFRSFFVDSSVLFSYYNFLIFVGLVCISWFSIVNCKRHDH